jgi:hypothetical protein
MLEDRQSIDARLGLVAPEERGIEPVQAQGQRQTHDEQQRNAAPRLRRKSKMANRIRWHHKTLVNEHRRRESQA